MPSNDVCYFDPTTNFDSPNPGEGELATLKRILDATEGGGSDTAGLVFTDIGPDSTAGFTITGNPTGGSGDGSGSYISLNGNSTFTSGSAGIDLVGVGGTEAFIALGSFMAVGGNIGTSAGGLGLITSGYPTTAGFLMASNGSEMVPTDPATLGLPNLENSNTFTGTTNTFAGVTVNGALSANGPLYAVGIGSPGIAYINFTSADKIILGGWSGVLSTILLGGYDNTHPAIKVSGTSVSFCLADDSGDAPVSVGDLTASGTITGDLSGGYNLSPSQFDVTPVADGTYTVGLGVSTNGTITITSGFITAIQEAS